jgi:hypothetical protein
MPFERLKFMTLNASSQEPGGRSAHRRPPGRRQRTVDIGWATIVAAMILAVGGVAGVFIGLAFASGPAPVPAASGPARIAASVTIDQPPTGDIRFESNLSGTVEGLKAGQLVWTFAQIVNKDGSFSPVTYPQNGPCIVDYSTRKWTCRHVFIGLVKDSETFRVCAAIVTLPEASVVVTRLENTFSKNPGLISWFTSPPNYVDDRSDASCMSVHRVN